MTGQNIPPNLSCVNPEDLAFILRDLADCRTQLAREREELAKVRGEKKEAERRLEKATQDSHRWSRIAVQAMHKNQVLRQEQLGDVSPRLRLSSGGTAWCEDHFFTTLPTQSRPVESN